MPENGIIESIRNWFEKPFGEDNEPNILEITALIVFGLTVAFVWNKVIDAID